MNTLDKTIATLDDFMRSSYYESYRESIFSNMAIDGSERYERVIEAAEDGCDGSMHCEVIQDMRDAVSDAQKDGVISEETEESILAEIDSVEAWHESNGSLYQVIG